MFIFINYLKTIGHLIFVIIIIFFSTSQARNLDKFDNSDSIADYFSGVLLLNQNQYKNSYNYFKRLEGLEKNHTTFSLKYLYSTINSENFNQAFSFAKKLEKENKESFVSNFTIGIKHLKNSKFELASEYFLKAKNSNTSFLLNNYIAEYLYLWSNLKNLQPYEAKVGLNRLADRFENLNKIQNVFLNCYYGNSNIITIFDEFVSDKKTDFSRYNYFYATYLINSGQNKKGIEIINNSLKIYPRNLLLNQFKIDMQILKKKTSFNCKNEKDVIAEILYIAANALASQSIYSLSNLYINFAKYLNNDFKAYDILLAENLYNTKDFINAKNAYKKLSNYGSAYNWYSKKQLSRILIQENDTPNSLKALREAYNDLPSKGVYETFDYADFLKNNKKFEEAIKYYSEVLNQIDKKHSLYPKAKDGRGVAYERAGHWKKAEKDLLDSLEINPNQAYVINYLAYSWIEKGIKIDKSLSMLEKANKLKSNDPYIIDSLGWALYKLQRFEDSKEYLQLAVRLLPADPIVNDHYGDVLWKNGKEIQARYYWNYVLSLEKTEKDLKEKIKKKLIVGL